MLGEAVVLNGSGAIAATTVGWRGEDANAFAAVVEANDTLLEALQPEASLCEIQGATRHYRNQSFPRGAHMALGLSWCAAAIARHEAAHGQRFGLVAYARPDQFFAGPVTPWCRWPSATTALACHAPGSDGFWAAPRDLAAQIFGMAEAITQCQRSHSASADSRTWALTNASSDPPKSRDIYRPTAPGRLDAVFNFMGAV